MKHERPLAFSEQGDQAKATERDDAEEASLIVWHDRPIVDSILSQSEAEMFADASLCCGDETVFAKTVVLGRLLRGGFVRELEMLEWRPARQHAEQLSTGVEVVLTRSLQARRSNDAFGVLSLLDDLVSVQRWLESPSTERSLRNFLGLVEVFGHAVEITKAHLETMSPRAPRLPGERAAYWRVITVAYARLGQDPRDLPDDRVWSEDPALAALRRLDPALQSGPRSG